MSEATLMDAGPAPIAYDETEGAIAKLAEVQAEAAALHAIVHSECRWACNDDGAYDTGCDETFECMYGTVSDNGFIHCPYCGGTIDAKEGAE